MPWATCGICHYGRLERSVTNSDGGGRRRNVDGRPLVQHGEVTQCVISRRMIETYGTRRAELALARRGRRAYVAVAPGRTDRYLRPAHRAAAAAMLAVASAAP